MSVMNNLRRMGKHNAHTFKSSPLAEISGSLGDLGTLLPIFIALSLNDSINVSSTLVFTGLANIASGMLFGVPIPVQPMKAIAAVAIEQHFVIRETAMAGLLVSGAVLLLAISGALGWLGRIVPIPIVRGIQLGAGLSLVIAAGTNLLRSLGWIRPSWADNNIWTLFAFIFLLFSTVFTRQHIPYALVVTSLGVVLAMLRSHHQDHAHPGVWEPHIYLPHWNHVKAALPAAIGQLPLTTLNSILATSSLSHHLLPDQPTPSLTHLGLSLGITNLISWPFGAMPICHGSGGLAAQYRFGARSGASVIFLGVIKLILGLFFASPVVWVVQRFPHSLLGIMVVFAGIELAAVAESINDHPAGLGTDGEGRHSFGEEEERKRFSVMLVTAAGILAFKNDAIGFFAGVIWHIGVNWDEVRGGWSSRHSRWFSRFRRSGLEHEPLL
jgi:MFS superfamily sulfate permease-like transporter